MGKYIKYLIFLISSVIVGCVLMICVYHVPVEWMKENLRESAGILYEEGMDRVLIKGYSHTKLDNFTDTLMLNVATCEGTGSTVHKAMLIPNTYYDGMDWLEKVIENIEEIETIETANYQRYWHGYLVVLKPLLTVFSYQDIRAINGFVQCILLGIVFSLLYKKLGIRYILAFAVTVFFLNPSAISLSMQYSAVYYITLFCMMLLLAKNEWFEEEGRYELLFMGTGIMIAYFDLLTYPLVSLGIPLVTFLVINNQNLSKQIISMFKMSIFWFFGYAGMWAGKWCMCALLTKDNTFGNALGAFQFRTSGSAIDAIIGNLHVLYNKSTIMIGIIILLISVAGLLYNKCRVSKLILPLICVGFYPFIWYAVLKNHSTIHVFSHIEI